MPQIENLAEKDRIFVKLPKRVSWGHFDLRTGRTVAEERY
jgi:hypothetical protein